VVTPAPAQIPARAIGRYLLFGEIAAGGMATVHFGRLSGPAGFSRTVAIKRLHPNLAKDPEFVAMFLDEARLAARIRHPNVVPTLDVVATEGEIFLVMDYVQGESLSRLRIAMQDAKRATDPRIVAAIMSGVLHGLHAAHEAKSEQGQSLNIVHRDVSPQNVLVGIDGVARVLDFGVAKAIGRVQTTREGQIKGKLAYMPPEQLHGGRVTRQADVYAAAVVTWEALTGNRLFSGEHEGALLTSILSQPIPLPSKVAPHVPSVFDKVVMRGIDRDPTKRYTTAREMALDLERCAGVASTSEVGEWVETLAGAELSKRAALMAAIEGSTPTRPSDRVPITASSATSDMPTNPAVDEPKPSPKEGDLRSDVSHVAVAPTLPRPPRAWGRIAVLASSVSVVLVAVLVVVLASGHKTTTRGHVAAAGSAEPTASPPLAQSTGELPSDVGADPASSAPASSPGANRDTPLPTKAHSAVSAGTARPPSRPPKSDCATPFTIDDKGHKHYKAACL
jgi:eukaryotic-like serine/threonine-protein kinase